MNARTRWLLLATLCCPLPALAGGAPADAVIDEAYDCLIEPGSLVDVGSASRGIVSYLHVGRGEQVRFEQPIVELESTSERNALQLARTRAAMHSEVASRRADLELARLDRRRFDDPRARQLTTGKLRDEADARERVAHAPLVQAEESVRLRAIERQSMQNELDRRTIVSPLDGVVIAELVAPGELVFDTPVMRLAALDPLHVELVLEARLFGTVRIGDTARVVPELDDDAAHEAIVTIVDPMIDAGSGTFGVRLELANPERAIPAGQRCRVELVDAAPAAAMPSGGDEPSR